MPRYEVVLEDVSAKSPRNRWTMFLTAENYGDAEEQAKLIVLDNSDNSEIIAIHKELD